MRAWSEVLYGYIVVFLGVLLLKKMWDYQYYKKSIYPYIYSSYFEYMIRSLSVTLMSKSSWIESRFGHHRIIYLLKKDNNEYLFSYIVIFLKSGITIFQINKNKGFIDFDQQGCIVEENNPIFDSYKCKKCHKLRYINSFWHFCFVARCSVGFYFFVSEMIFLIVPVGTISVSVQNPNSLCR